MLWKHHSPPKSISFARHKGVSAETLLNLWVQEKIHELAV
jgi:hypothetical protein